MHSQTGRVSVPEFSGYNAAVIVPQFNVIEIVFDSPDSARASAAQQMPRTSGSAPRNPVIARQKQGCLRIGFGNISPEKFSFVRKSAKGAANYCNSLPYPE
jgi:hypothetical protein